MSPAHCRRQSASRARTSRCRSGPGCRTRRRSVSSRSSAPRSASPREREMSGFGRHRLLQVVTDAGIVALSWFLAFELRFDQGLPVYYDTLLRRTILLVVAIKVLIFLLFGFHRRWWRYVSVHDMWSAARGVVVASLVAYLTVYLLAPVHNVRLPRSIAVMDLLLTLALVAGARLLARTVIERPRSGDLVARGREVIVVGAGDAGRTVVQEMQRSRMLRYTPIGFVDDDRAKLKSRIQGV